MYNNIINKINFTKIELAKNPIFYDQFKLNSAYTKMENAKDQLKFNFSNLWAWTEPDVNLIDQIVKTNLTGNAADLLKQINDAKQIITNVNVTV